MRNRKVHSSDVWISLTDPAEREYEIEWKEYGETLIGWGTPEGVFHLSVDSSGRLSKTPRLPGGLAALNDHAIYLDWADGEFINESGEKIHEEIKSGDTIRIHPLSQIYVKNCFPEQDFVKSDSLPGALVPDFNGKPTLSCAASSDWDENVTVFVVEDHLE